MSVSKDQAIPCQQVIKDQDIIDGFGTLGPYELAKRFNVDPRAIFARRRRIERRNGIALLAPKRGGHVLQLDNHPAAIQLGLQEGHILIGSDAHYLPGRVSTAHRAFIEFAKEYQPKVIVKNGDVLDFPRLSRFAPIGWEDRPNVVAEIEVGKEMLNEIQKSSPKSRLIWPLGNHDGRFESRLANIAPEYAKVHGVHLKDHFPDWEPCWAAFVNHDVVIKHRIKGGIHATRNNALNAGRTTITGHLHQLKVTPLSDYNGTRFGVDCGTMADPYGPQFFNYTELNPLDWRSGFILLTFVKGRLLWPEVIHVISPDEVEFRGAVHRV